MKYVARGLVTVQTGGLRPILAHTCLFLCVRKLGARPLTKSDQLPVQGEEGPDLHAVGLLKVNIYLKHIVHKVNSKEGTESVIFW